MLGCANQAKPALLSSVQRGSFVSVFAATGTVEGLRQVDIGSTMTGRIWKLCIKEGDTVQQGAIIAHIEEDQLVAQVGQAKANLAMMKAGLIETESNLSNSKIEFERTQKLYEEGDRPKRTFDKVKTEYDALTAQCEAARARIDQAEASLKLAQAQLADATIRAPFSGVIIRKYVEEGQVISAMSLMGGNSSSIVTLADVSKMIIRAKIDEEDIGKIKVGQPADIVLDGIPDSVLKGTVSQILNQANKGSKTIDVKILVVTPSSILRPDMTVDVSIIASKRDKVLYVLKQMIIERNGAQGVYRVQDGKVNFTPITFGSSDRGKIEIVSGLGEGDIIAMSIKKKLRDGELVKAVPQ